MDEPKENLEGAEKSWETFLDGLQPNRTSFYVKVGSPYKGVFFTLDPVIVQFSKSDCLNQLVTSTGQDNQIKRVINLGKLKQVFKKCPNIENLKFFGVEISADMIKLITKNCPNLKNLELNLQETDDVIEQKFVLDFLPEFKRFQTTCRELRNLIIRRPSKRVETFFLRKCFPWDNVDRNWLFIFKESGYDMYTRGHHKVSTNGSGGCINNVV